MRPASPADPAPRERTTRGVATLFEESREDGSHAVLDLGPASESSLAVYGRYARRIRFVDLLSAAASQGWTAALAALPEQPEHPYDLLLAWDVLDRVPPEARPLIVARLTEVSGERARLHLVVDASGRRVVTPLRFSLVDVGVLRCVPAGPPRPSWPPFLPAEVGRLLRPFHVMHGFTTVGGLREYVAAR